MIDGRASRYGRRPARNARVPGLVVLAALALAACASGLADDDLLAGAHVGTNAEFAGVASDLDDDTTRRLVGASRDLAVALVAGAEGSDVVVSPLGLQLALAV